MNTPATARPPLRVQVRKMARDDLAQVIAIHGASEKFPRSEESIVAVLRRHGHCAGVAQYGDSILGYVIHRLDRNRITVLDFAVLPASRTRGVGRQLMSRLIANLSEDRRTRIVVDVRESNLAAQLFLHALGFRAVEIRGGQFPPDGEDAYRFMYSIQDACSGR